MHCFCSLGVELKGEFDRTKGLSRVMYLRIGKGQAFELGGEGAPRSFLSWESASPMTLKFQWTGIPERSLLAESFERFAGGRRR